MAWDYFQLKLGWNLSAPYYISVNIQCGRLANLENEKWLSTCRLHPSKTMQPASQRLLFMIWMERHVRSSVPPRPLLWDQHAAWPWLRSACSIGIPPWCVLFDFSILFPLLLCFGCCVLRCRVSLVRSFPSEFKLVTQLGRGTFLFRDAVV